MGTVDAASSAFKRYSSLLFCALVLIYHFKATSDMLKVLDLESRGGMQQETMITINSIQEPRCNCTTNACDSSRESLPKEAGEASVAITATARAMVESKPQSAITPKTTPSLPSSPSSFSFKSMVWTVHIPKTGGRTLRELYARWMDQSPNCDMCATCSKKGVTAQDAYNIFYMPATKSVLGVSPDRPYNKKCRALDQEASLPLMWETRKVLGVPIDLPWYVTTLVRNPVSRFVSSAKHMVRAQRCDDKNQSVSTATQYMLDGDCDNVLNPYWTYHADQFSFFFNASFSPDSPFAPPVPFPRRWTSMGPMKQWDHIQRNLNLILLTEYMHVSECLLATDLAKAHFIKESFALESCKAASGIDVASFGSWDSELEPLSTSQLINIVTKAHPLDPILYPRALAAFRNRLKAITTTRRLFRSNDFPDADKIFAKEMRSLGKEIKVWSKVGEWLQDYHRQVRQGSVVAAWQGLAHRLDELTPDDKEIVAPSLGWGREQTDSSS